MYIGVRSANSTKKVRVALRQKPHNIKYNVSTCCRVYIVDWDVKCLDLLLLSNYSFSQSKEIVPSNFV